MEINTCKTLIALARANIPQELLGDILVPAVGLADREDYWNQAAAHLALGVAEHQVSTGELSPERLKETLEALTTKNVLDHLGGKKREYFVSTDKNLFVATVACIRSLFGTGCRLTA